ncbi:MAG: NUMOD3 domain-containing DNA-binding protein [Candidatus Pacearchaeota archaeon]|nr:NUMOD3 domain-containing DNA-binding protein [Candidatus Pacearchaeota archaeon]
MNSGIYEILNTENGKKYIGSAVNIRKRWNYHLSMLRREIHPNKHLQRAFDKYGEGAFQFIVLERILFSEGLIPLEQKYLNKLKPEYNIVPTAGNNLGMKFTEEIRNKISKAKKGQHWKVSEEGRKNMSEAKKGNSNTKGKHWNLSEETKRHISEVMKEAMKGNSNAKGNKNNLGRHWSEKVKKHMSEAHKGEKNYNYGRYRSEETRKKISETLKEYWEKRRKDKEIIC